MNNALVSKLGHQASILRAVVADHRDAIARAQARVELEAERVETHLGFHPADAADLCPAYSAARAEVERLSDDSGYYWACAALTDLEMLLPTGGQLMIVSEETTGMYGWCFRGTMPRLHEDAVAFIARATFGLSDESTLRAVQMAM